MASKKKETSHGGQQAKRIDALHGHGLESLSSGHPGGGAVNKAERAIVVLQHLLQSGSNCFDPGVGF